MEQTKQEIISDLKKLHTTDESRKKSREYYKQYYKQNKDKYKKRYQQNKRGILDKMKESRQLKKTKNRGIFTIRHVNTEETIISGDNEDQH
jgi:hypothetical protein